MRQFEQCGARVAFALALACLLYVSLLVLRFDHAPAANEVSSPSRKLPASDEPRSSQSSLAVASAPVSAPASAAATATSSTRPSDVFYERALQLYDAASERDLPQRVHLIRVPKAGSTATSVVARRLAGCTPAGPCCKYPGSPPGSCPQPGLMCPQIIGCIGHHTYMGALFSPKIPSLMMMRQPISRALSAFFYPGIHHNSDCKKSHEECFEEYMASKKWRNVAVKMLTGAAAYDNVVTCMSGCRHSFEAAVNNLGNATFVGVSELWELSILLFHSTFPGLRPEKTEFSLGVNDGSSTSSDEKPAFDVRTNTNEAYLKFRQTARQVYGPQLEANNEPDLRLYEVVVKLMCSRLRQRGLWDDYVAEYWAQRTDIPCEP